MNQEELINAPRILFPVGTEVLIKGKIVGLKAVHADEAPRYVKNILARLRELPLHNREVWLKVIMSEFKQDFSHAKWREGYEQGKFEGVVECEKVTIPQFVADWIANVKRNGFKFRNTSGYYEEIAPSDDVYRVMYYIFKEGIVGEKIKSWINENRDLFARAWLDGYEVEEEKRYRVKIKNMSEENTYLTFRFGHTWMLSNFEESEEFRLHHTRKELEDANFGWVFDCPGIEIEEVE
ncbi:DUF1642 domain-containing protein [Streptococcus oralis]|uniref:DUF1642 domain-containing protein n=1 Tax=Streptococcus oralis TaxID=1303 RepID=UPI000A110482|nr:DUF1642 domain-containing protein [Streptococcus oralis]